MSKRKQLHPELKVEDALEALMGEETVGELASQFGAHPTDPSVETAIVGRRARFFRGSRKTPEVGEEQVKGPPPRQDRGMSHIAPLV